MEFLGLKIYQWLVIFFAAFALSRVAMQKKQKNFSWNEFFFWMIIWFGLIIVAFSRNILQYIANFLEIDRGVDILIYASIVLLFYMVYRLYAMVDRQHQEITTLVSKIAIEKAKNKKK